MRMNAPVIPALGIHAIHAKELKLSGVDFASESVNHSHVFVFEESRARTREDQNRRAAMPKYEQFHSAVESRAVPVVIVAAHDANVLHLKLELRMLSAIPTRMLVLLAALPLLSPAAISNATGKVVDPFASTAHARVFIFARTDCPLTHRYAPELQRIWREFSGRGVDFWMVYPDPAETRQSIEADFSQYGYPGKALRDPRHELVTRARAAVAPEAAVFDSSGRLVYHGRIDDQWIDFGKARPVARVHDLENVVAAVLAGKQVPEAETRAVGCSLADVK